MNATNAKGIITLAAIAASLIASAAQADTAYIVSAANLADENGALAATSSVVLLVLDTGGNGFTSLVATTSLIVGSSWGDDLVVGRWDLSALNTPGQLLGFAKVSHFAAVTTGDPFRLYWFPHRTAAATIVGCERYGYYGPDLVGMDGSYPWQLPADTGALLHLNFYTASRGGSNPDSAGWSVSGPLTATDPSEFISTITPGVDGTNVVLTFTTHECVYYDIESRTDLDSSTWSIIATNVPGTGVVLTNIHVGGAIGPQRFYRLHQQ